MPAQAPLPGPDPLPLLGNVLDVERNLVEAFTRHWHAHGDVFRLRFGPKDVVVLAHPDDVEHVLHDKAGHYSRLPYRRLERITGEGLLVSDGATWRRSRRVLQPLFSKRSVHTLVPDLVASTDELLDRWHGRARLDDLTHEMGWVTLRAITRTLFAWDIRDELDTFCDDVGVLAGAINSRLVAPPAFDRLPTPANLRFGRASRRIQSSVERCIADQRAHGDDEGLLGQLLSARDDDGQPLSDDQVRDELITLFMAGHETTALTLTWIMNRLSLHPDWYARLVEEVDALDEPLSAASLRQLPLTMQVVQEVLRLHPSAWVFPRRTTAPDTLPSGHTVPVDAGVLLSPYLSHRHPDYWDNPLGFDPTRFGPDAPKRHPCAYYPFGRASRMCIGRELALVEAVTITARMLQRVRISALQPARDSAQGTLRPASAMPVALTWRPRMH
ncbi:MAG: cytochrome P450 [Myxococcota bacterium]